MSVSNLAALVVGVFLGYGLAFVHIYWSYAGEEFRTVDAEDFHDE